MLVLQDALFHTPSFNMAEQNTNTTLSDQVHADVMSDMPSTGAE